MMLIQPGGQKWTTLAAAAERLWFRGPTVSSGVSEVERLFMRDD